MSETRNYEPLEILELFNKRATIIKPGLSRIQAALELLGHPSLSIPRIVIAGTNGKGTTSGMIWRLLAAAGLRVGLFSSPHLVEFRERITISGGEVSNQTIVDSIKNLKKQLPPELWDELSFFEINTILAFLIFEDRKTDVNVLEVGLGGRLDCVNVYDPHVAVITSIGLDHTEYLGNSLAQIAREKAGIMRSGAPVIWCAPGWADQEADDSIRNVAKQLGARLTVANEVDLECLPKSFSGRPSFIKRNFLLARAAVREFLNSELADAFPRHSIDELVAKFDSPQLPWPVTFNGRFDLLRVSKGPHTRVVLLDVCHNPHGANALRVALEETGIISHGQRLNCLISVLADKDAAGIWGEIKGKISEVIPFRIASVRSWSQVDRGIPGLLMESFEQAWSEALDRASWQSKDPWLVFGSVAAVGEVFGYWQRAGWSMERINLDRR